MDKPIIKSEIKQLLPIEPGWKFWYIVVDTDDDEIQLYSAPVTAQAIIFSSGYRDNNGGFTETETTVDFVVFDDDSLKTYSDARSDAHNAINTCVAGITPPSESFTMDSDEVVRAIDAAKKKWAEYKSRLKKTA